MNKKFTIGCITRNKQIFDKYLKKSLDSLEGEFDVIFTNDEKMPAHNYNYIISQCKTPYLVLTHEDVSFPSHLLESIELTMQTLEENKKPFGVIGMVGVDSLGKYRWSSGNTLYRVDTLDSCLITFKTDTVFRFDEINFDDCHLYVEDFCAKHNNVGLNTYTIAIDSEGVLDTDWDENIEFDKLRHHSSTISKEGFMWGKWTDYKLKFMQIWPGLKTT